MSQIPSDIVREILLRLPAESLLRLRSVCREWCNIIDDKSFILSHSVRSQLSPTTLLIGNRKRTLLYSISVDSLINCADHDRGKLEATCVQDFTSTWSPEILDSRFRPCNGLILRHSGNPDKENWVILNPITQKSHELPRLPGFEDYPSAGLGYDSSSDDYKVVAIGRYKGRGYDDPYCSFLYSMKTDSWIKIGDVDRGDIGYLYEDGVFFNGFLHWTSKFNYSLTRFNLATELYDELSLPKFDRELWFCDIGLLDGSLCVSLYCNERRCLGVWEMKDGGWMKLFSFESSSSLGIIRPIAYLKRKGLVLLITKWSSELFLFDIEKNSSRILDIVGFPDKISSIVCFPGSLVQLDRSSCTDTD